MKARILAGVCALAVVWPRPALAIFGEEDWISGQNQLLVQMLVTELEATANLGQVILTARAALTAANDTLALARTVKRVYEAVRNYDLEDLKRDALLGLYKAIPEAKRFDAEVRELVGNGRAMKGGEFWGHLTPADPRVSAASRKLFEHGYKAALWPMVLPSMQAKGELTPVEKLIQERYRRSGQQAEQALQKSAYGVLAEQVKTFVADADSKKQVDLKMAATQTQLQLQTAQDTTELLNLQRVKDAENEAARKSASEFHKRFSQGLSIGARVLVEPGRADK